MRVFRRYAIIAALCALALAGGKRAPPDKTHKGAQPSVRGSATPESQDPGDFNPQVPVTMQEGQAGEDVDELASDSDDPSASGNQHVHFEEPPRTPTHGRYIGPADGLERTPEPPKVPETPDSLGRYLLGHQRSASDTDLYHRPSHAKTRLAQPQNDDLDRKWHRWYIFNNEDRRKRFSDMKKQFIGTSYDLSASTGASMVSFLGRPERDPAHPDHLGEMIVSRDIMRNKQLYKAALELFNQFKKLIASPRRREYNDEFQRAVDARNAHDTAVQQYESTIAVREQAARAQTAQTVRAPGRTKRKRATRKGKEKAHGDDGDASGSTRSEEDAPDLDATPRRPPPNLRNRQAERQLQLPESEAEEDDESDASGIPEPQRLFVGAGTLGFEDMALDDEDFAAQLGEAAQQNRRDNEAQEFRRSKRGESSGQQGGSSSRGRGDAMDVDKGEDGYSSRARISNGRPDASDASDRSTSSRRDGPSTRAATRAAGGSGTSSGAAVGPSGLIAEVVVPLRPRPLPPAAHGPPGRPPQQTRGEERVFGRQGSASQAGHSRSATDASSASGASHGHQRTLAMPAPIAPRTNAMIPLPPRSAGAPGSVRGCSPPVSVRPRSPASIRTHAPANHPHAPPTSSGARSLSNSAQGRPLSGRPPSPPVSIPPTLDAGVTSEPDALSPDVPASELPVRIRDWLVLHHVPRSIWVDVEMAYFIGLAELPAGRRATWTSELEQLQGGLLINAAQLKDLVLVMLRCAVGR
ncbi:hypothetical protein AURDEDRAFT_174896 [Auricularia subglabra TFB-10046 SS5]|nr:hypothetical protein AURDEDRAFT_174896 [Auricularia subglabra TFB-10046 SS5]